MGVKLKDLVTTKQVSIGDFAHKVVAIDAYNILYQFLTTIRMRDGTPLTSSTGKTTSHLVGLFSRLTNFLENNMKLVFVYDGTMPQLKTKEVERRKIAKKQAEKKLEKAVQAEDIAGMKKYAGRTAVLTKEMVAESQKLLDALGIPWVQAPSEAEAQAAHMVRNGDADYVSSQDYDCLLFGAPVMVKNLSITGKRKRPGTSTYYTIEPELLDLKAILTELQISQKQLIALGMLVGTDFNPGGVKGLGPKKSLKIVQEHGEDLEKLFAEVEWDEHNDVAWEDVYDVISNMPVTDEYTLEWKSVDRQAVMELLVEGFEFSAERVHSTLDRIATANQQKGLGEFF